MAGCAWIKVMVCHGFGVAYIFFVYIPIYICDMNPGHMPIPCRPTCLCASAIWLAASTRAYREGGKLG